MTKVKKNIRDILSITDIITDEISDIKQTAIKMINLLDLSELTLMDIRVFDEHIRSIMKKTITVDKSDCYNKLLNKLYIEKCSRSPNLMINEMINDVKRKLLIILDLIKHTSTHTLSKSFIIKDINLLDLSKMHIDDIKEFIEFVRDIIKNEHSIAAIECYNKLITKLTDALPDIKKTLEESVNDSVSNYFVDGVVVVSNYIFTNEYNEDCKLDGMIIGKDVNDENVVIFVKTEYNMNSDWEFAQRQMHHILAYWRLLKELVSDGMSDYDKQTYLEDIETLKVREFKNCRIRCAFGSKKFSHVPEEQFKSFDRYNWLKITK